MNYFQDDTMIGYLLFYILDMTCDFGLIMKILAVNGRKFETYLA